YGARGQKGDIWDGGHHVPFIVKWPATIKGPIASHQTIGLIDIIATLSELTGQPVANTFAEDSYSFYKILNRNSEKPTRDQIIYLSSRGKLAIKAGDWKYIDGLGSGGFTAPAYLEPVEGGPRGQLYNLKKDPLEQNNLYLEEPQMVRQLSELLNNIVDQKDQK
ncbi:MAG: sulfatase-like hydrolase/transferase, partial [Bacteroidales bacterium]|nr:sulfatase-like hydrolase/transferase [Bacteroidales bacterium]